MTTAINRPRIDQDVVFTSVEHAVLARWLVQPKPAAAASIKLDGALAELGFGTSCRPYSQSDAAVAHSLLEAVDHRLMAFTRMDGDEGQRPPSVRAASAATATGGTAPAWTIRHRLVLVCTRH